ncbi:pyridoxal phosphate-dependent aminotransferase [Sandaracinus amylolyticus]|uniref:Aspartate aminotransferase n=1 Tax=Sandaracinus amylolyticus TaxID=927083 RepID=A0A0F6WAD6_9BACT|nr:aminotransferase class I/II-fold pyridoxal phosphate-dependent enzyme [Sandaracinus amylolyticus]AKF11506.1 Aspartate aminotransferase [Sandaracinus amylolyticus]
MATTDLTSIARTAPTSSAPRVSTMAEGLVGSEILKIAAEIRALIKGGRTVCNLTVGDFDPKQFPIPDALKKAIVDAYDANETNYPPSNGMPELRDALPRFYERELGLRYPLESFLVASGARPVIYGIYRAVVDPGDTVVYPVPSWNNNHYVHMLGAKGVTVPCGPESRFLPSKSELLATLPTARLVCLNSPLNPTGTAMARDQLLGVCEAICAENAKRASRGEKPVYLMYDHIYWMLTAKGTEHYTPPQLVPEMAKYTIFVDGISKAFAATGVRVGWAVGPTDVIDRMSAIIGHVGAWAPRAEQIATARLLDDTSAIKTYVDAMHAGLGSRLNALHEAFQSMKSSGLPVDSLSPEGAIYLTVRIAPFGKKTPSGAELKTNEDVRRYVLEAAGVGIVPFQAFGVPGDDGWFRLSVGAVSEREIRDAMPRLAEALKAL